MGLLTEKISNKEDNILKDANIRRDENRLRQSQKEAEYKDVEQRIKLEYPNGITEPRLK